MTKNPQTSLGIIIATIASFAYWWMLTNVTAATIPWHGDFLTVPMTSIDPLIGWIGLALALCASLYCFASWTRILYGLLLVVGTLLLAALAWTLFFNRALFALLAIAVETGALTLLQAGDHYNSLDTETRDAIAGRTVHHYGTTLTAAFALAVAWWGYLMADPSVQEEEESVESAEQV